MLIPALLEVASRALPDEVAASVVDIGAMTFSEWDRRSNDVARALAGLELAIGARVGLLFTNDEALNYYVGYFGIQKAGGVAVPISPRYSQREIEHVLSDSGADILLVGGTELDKARAARAATVRLLVAPGANGPGEVEWEHVASGDGSAFARARDEDDLADIMYTSGTTGRPKGVAITHRNATIGYDVSASQPHAAGKLLNSTPLATHFGAFGILHSCVRFGFTNLLLPHFDAARFAHLIHTERPTMVAIVPTMGLLLLKEGGLDTVDTSSVMAVTVGGGALPPSAIAELSALFPKAVYLQGYGMTESGSTACTIPPGEALKRPGTSGRPQAGTEVRIVDEDGNPVSPGTVGEILLHGPAVTGGRYYYNDPEASSRTWRDGWLFTGDLGYVDEDGYIYVTDRKKDMIKRGGYNIFSLEIENALYEHPDIEEAAVIGVPHDVLLEDVLAVVRLRDGAALDVDAMRAFLLERLADYKVPRRYVVRDDPMPRAEYGKISKAALREQYSRT